MSKLIVYKNIQKGDFTLLAGKVTKCNEGTGSAAGKVVNVTLTGPVWDKEAGADIEKSIEVAFWNSDKQKLADRIVAAKVGVGSFITALVILKDDNKATGLNFKYSGHWHFEAKDEVKEINILVGTMASYDEDEAGRYVRVSVPVQVKDGTEWHRATFWNNEDSKMADRAKACLKPRSDGKKAKAILICGENKPFNEQANYTGFRFELIPTEN